MGLIEHLKTAGIRLPAFGTLELHDSPDGIRLKHELKIGFSGFGRIIDPWIRLYFTKSFASLFIVLLTDNVIGLKYFLQNLFANGLADSQST